VAKDYTRSYRIDYEETFSPVAMIESIMIMLSIAAFYDYEVWQMDVKTAFLNGKLDEKVSMTLLKGFVDPSILIKCVSLKDPSMDLSKRLVAGVYTFMKSSKNLDFLKVSGSPAYMSKLVGAL
jgi:Reverse transcriptase (RNA-dependent DNA polymerase)